MEEIEREPLIPTQRYGMSAAIPAVALFLLLPLTESISKEVAFAACVASPLLLGFSSALIFGNSRTRGLSKAILAGSLAHVLFYIIPALFALLGIPLARVFGFFGYFLIFMFPLGVLTSAVGAIFGWLAARAIRR